MGRGEEGVLPGPPEAGGEVGHRRDAGHAVHACGAWGALCPLRLELGDEAPRPAVEAHVAAHHDAGLLVLGLGERPGDAFGTDEGDGPRPQVGEALDEAGRADHEGGRLEEVACLDGEGGGVSHTDADDVDPSNHGAPPEAGAPLGGSRPRRRDGV